MHVIILENGWLIVLSMLFNLYATIYTTVYIFDVKFEKSTGNNINIEQLDRLNQVALLK